MIALLRKDLPWLLGFLNAGAITLAIVLGSEGFVHVWALPPTRLEGLFHAGWIAGAAMGLFAAAWDELLGARDYLRHRPVSRLRLHGARVLGCGIVLAVWFTLPVGVVWLLEATLGQNADQLRIGNVAEVWATLLPAVTATAIGLFAGSLPCHPLLRLAAGGAALLATFSAVDTWTRTDPFTASMAGFCVLHLGAAALFALASFASAGRDADADRPWPAPSLFAGGAVALPGFALLGAMAIGAVQRALLDRLHMAYPQIVAGGGTLQLAAASQVDGRRTWWPVDRDHQVTGAPLDHPELGEVTWSGSARARMEPGFDAPRFHWSRTSLWRGPCLLFDDGRAFLLFEQGYTGRVSVVTTGKGPDRERFAADAQVLDARTLERRSTWIAEPSAGALWRLDAAQQFFVPAPLPDGDHLQMLFTGVRPDERDPLQRLEVGDLVYRLSRDEHEVLVGERGVYRLGGDTIDAAPAWMQNEVQKRRRPRMWQPERIDPDLVGPRLVVRDADGATVFEHQYTPRTAIERSWAGLAFGGSLLRPPALAIVAHAVAAPGPQQDPLLDPLLAGGRRPLLLLGNLLAAAACSFAARRRLRRFGAEAPRRRWWIAACLLLGPLALLAVLLVERRRAWAPSPLDEVPVVPPRIASPAST